MTEIKNLRRWVKDFFSPIDWSTFFTHGSNGNTCYGFEAIFKLSYLLGCKTYRSKSDFLEVLEKQNKTVEEGKELNHRQYGYATIGIAAIHLAIRDDP